MIEISFYDAKPALTVEDATEMQNNIILDYRNDNSVHWGMADRNPPRSRAISWWD